MIATGLRRAADRRPPATANAGPYNSNSPLTTPTPDATGYATHVDVVHSEAGILGYKYLMALTPYAGLNNALENPCILVSQDNIAWAPPPGVTNPLVPYGGGAAYNSDPDICVGNDGKVYIYYRQAGGGADNIFVISSSNLSTWSTPLQVVQAQNDQCLSPTIDFDGVNYRMYSVAGNGGVQLRIAPSPSGPWTAPRDVSLQLPSGNSPWHMDLTVIRGRYVMTLNEPNGSGQKHIRIATSRDGIRFQVSPRLITDAAQSVGGTVYRGCTELSADGLRYRIWYSTLSASCRIFYTEIPVSEMP